MSKLGIFDSLDKRDVQDLVKRDLDSDRNGNVSIKEFLAFCRNSKAPSSTKMEKGGDDEDLDFVAQTYEFSRILTSAPSKRNYGEQRGSGGARRRRALTRVAI